MFKKTSSFALIAVFLLMAAATAYVFLTEEDQPRSFRKQLTAVDTAQLSTVILTPSATQTPLTFNKSGDIWSMTDETGNKQIVETAKVMGLVMPLIDLKPNRLASKNDAKWEEYQVDGGATSTRIQVKEGSKEVVNLVVGKLNISQNPNAAPPQGGQMGQFGGGQAQPSFSTYVRLEGEKETYVINDMMGMTYNRKKEDFLPPPPPPEPIDTSGVNNNISQ